MVNLLGRTSDEEAMTHLCRRRTAAIDMPRSENPDNAPKKASEQTSRRACLTASGGAPMKKPPAITIVLLVITLQIARPTPSAACPVLATLWDVIELADWIAIVRVSRIEVDPSPGNPSSGDSEEHEVAVLEPLDVW